MIYDTSDQPAAFTYKLLTATVTPRPIAWITTLGPDGSVNAAPYSFFNAMGSEPPTLAVGLLRDPAKGFKDSAANIVDRGGFVVNLVSYDLAEQMNLTAIDAPTGVSELDLARLETAPSTKIAPPRIAAAPVSFECSLLSAVVTGPKQTIAIGRIEAIHIADDMLLDAARGHVDTPALDLIARLEGRGWYQRGGDRFSMDRPVYEADKG